MTIHVVGHKSPDTDSVASAIACAELKKKLGVDATPFVQGALNPETKLILEKFGFDAPALLGDVTGKQVILVDHSDCAQAPENIKEAELMEIIDHHKVGDITTRNPIFFLAMPVGCTGTVLYKLYQDNNVEVDKNVAGLMLSAILSDTVIFKSPTTTEQDKIACKALAQIAGVENMEAWAMEMFKAKSAVAGVPARELLFRDFKEFEMKGNKVGIGQLELIDLSLVDGIRDDLYDAVKAVKAEGGYHSIFFLLTDIMKEGSDVMVVTDDISVVKRAFDVDLEGASFWSDGMLSRKKQTVPPLQAVFENL